MSVSTNRAVALTIFAIGVLSTCAFGAIALLAPDSARDRQNCFIDSPPPRTLAVVLDISDQLVAGQPRQVSYVVEDAVDGLGSGDRVIVVDAAGKPPSEVEPVVNSCDPGDDNNVARAAFRSGIVVPIERHLAAVRTQPASQESPIAETIVSIAADPSLRTAGTRLEVMALTDGLQNSPFESAYRAGSDFPKPQPGLLAGITVRLVLLKNERDFALQPAAVSRLVSWLRAAGARVDDQPPAWLSLAAVPRHHHRYRHR